jgi:hypothetical protein
MKIIKISLTILIVGFYTAVLAQNNPVIENGQPYNKASVRPFLGSLQSDNDYVLTFRIKTIFDQDPDYFVLTKKGDKLFTYIYSQNTQKLTDLPVKTDSLKTLLWKAYTEFDIFKIKNEKELSVFCPEKYKIFDSYTYEIVLLSKDRMKLLSYYDPEYYDRVCYGMPERQKIINCASLIKYVLSFTSIPSPNQ